MYAFAVWSMLEYCVFCPYYIFHIIKLLGSNLALSYFCCVYLLWELSHRKCIKVNDTITLSILFQLKVPCLGVVLVKARVGEVVSVFLHHLHRSTSLCSKFAARCLVPKYIRQFLNALCRRQHRHEHKE